ncbi:hypothetical protein Tco_0441009, partial [Tanacetum coccineum]
NSGPLRSADNEKELWDSRMHQTGKEIGGEGMPKVLDLPRLKQGKVKIGVRIFPTFSGSLRKKPKQSALTIIFNLRTGRPSAFD